MAAVDTHAPGYSSFMGDAIEGMDDSWMPGNEILPAGEPDASILDELSSIDYMSGNAAQTAQPSQHGNHIATPALAVYHASNNPSTSLQCLSSPLTPGAATPSQFPSALKRKNLMSSSAFAPPAKKPALMSNFGNATKTEPVLVSEPLTPSSSQRQLHTMPSFRTRDQSSPLTPPQGINQVTPAPHPLSPLSAFSDEDDAAEAPSSSSPLPIVSAHAAAKRRLLRVRALKRQRARTASKQELCEVATQSSPTTASASADVEEKDEPDSVQVDKKTARAIRNRLAASRSRVEAKMKMQSLAEANDELATTVESLKAENACLHKQLQSLLAHTFGDNVPVNDVLSVFESLKSGR